VSRPLLTYEKITHFRFSHRKKIINTKTLTTFLHAANKAVYDFLRTALMHGDDATIPVRGPASYTEGEWAYRFVVDGNLGSFTGTEKILHADRVVYRCSVHGGWVE
jgi:hypothetical protein